MRCISSEIEDMRKLDCSPAVRDSEANREQVGNLEPFYTSLSPDISQHKFSDHAYGDNPLLNPLLDEESAVHCRPSRPFMTVMIGQAAKLDRRLAIGAGPGPRQAEEKSGRRRPEPACLNCFGEKAEATRGCAVVDILFRAGPGIADSPSRHLGTVTGASKGFVYSTCSRSK